MVAGLFKRWQWNLLGGTALFGFYFALGAYLCLARNYLPYDALARLVSAYLVFYGAEIKLATIGFVWPPIPTLLLLPFVLVPYLVKSWLAVVIVSSFFMMVSCFLVGRIARLCGVPDGWRRVVVLLFALNPLMVVFGANGMSEAILIAVTLAGCYWLVRFWQTDRNLDLLMSAGLFSLLPLIRYEAALLAAGAGLLIFIHSWLQGRTRLRLEEFRQFVEGRLLAFSALAIYPIFLWAVASWQIMGSPLYFLVNDRSALSLAGMQLSSYRLSTDLFSAFRLTFGVWIHTFPLGLIASLGAVIAAVRLRQPFLAGFGLFPFILPVTQVFLLTGNATVPLLRYFVMTVPLGIVVGLSTLKYYSAWPAGIHKRWSLVFNAALLVLFILSNYMSAVVMETYPYQNIERDTWRALTTQNPIENRAVEDALAVGKVLAEIIPEGSRVLIDTYQFGFAVILGAGDAKLFFDFTDPDYDQAVLYPKGFVDYLLVPTVEGRGAFYSINRTHPRLHEQGAPWAELVEALPDTTLQWRLYKIIR